MAIQSLSNIAISCFQMLNARLSKGFYTTTTSVVVAPSCVAGCVGTFVLVFDRERKGLASG